MTPVVELLYKAWLSNWCLRLEYWVETQSGERAILLLHLLLRERRFWEVVSFLMILGSSSWVDTVSELFLPIFSFASSKFMRLLRCTYLEGMKPVNPNKYSGSNESFSFSCATGESKFFRSISSLVSSIKLWVTSDSNSILMRVLGMPSFIRS